MKDNKGKALADELMDDLLSDESEKNQDNKVKGKSKSKKSKTKSSKASSIESDKTIALEIGSNKRVQTKSSFDDDHTIPVAQTESKTEPPTAIETRVHEKVAANFGHTMATVSGADAVLIQANNLKIAQQRILELEKETEELRTEKEKLGAAGETLRKRVDELLARTELLERKSGETQDDYKQEKELLLSSLESKDREANDLQLNIEELETRLSTNIQKIRVRERELENRLELAKLENSAVVRNKDEIILELKRQIDNVGIELENYRKKSQQLNRQLGDKQDILKRTVKALRLALNMLEGNDVSGQPLKKVD